MPLVMAVSAPGCVTVVVGGVADLALVFGAVAIPAVSIPLIMRSARRHPSAAFARDGRRPRGLVLSRWGVAAALLGIAGIVTAFVLGAVDPQPCDRPASTVAVVSIVLTILGALGVGGGWAYSLRANWVVLATLATVDVWIVYVALLLGIGNPESLQALVVLAFAIHACCTGVAGRWSFNAVDLDPIGRAKAGEAGRTLGAVWVFLATYSVLAWFRGDNDVFSSGAGSAVVGALTVGALAVTMGSGYTKYAEAIHGSPAMPPPVPQKPAETTPEQPAGDTG